MNHLEVFKHWNLCIKLNEREYYKIIVGSSFTSLSNLICLIQEHFKNHKNIKVNCGITLQRSGIDLQIDNANDLDIKNIKTKWPDCQNEGDTFIPTIIKYIDDKPQPPRITSNFISLSNPNYLIDEIVGIIGSIFQN